MEKGPEENAMLDVILDEKHLSKDVQRPHDRIIENFLIVWVDLYLEDFIDEDTRQVIDHLRQVVNTVKTFHEIDKCVEFLVTVKNERIFLLISGSLGQQIVPCVHKIDQLHSIYIFCANKDKHDQWTQRWSKIKGVFIHIDSIRDAIKKSIEECEQNLIPVSFLTQTEIIDRNVDHIDQSFMYTQILKEILFQIEYNEKSIKTLIDFINYQYSGNEHELDMMKMFEKTYHRRSPIWWYTYPSCIHSMLNRALRLHEIDVIVRMGFFIRDLHRQIEQLHRQQSAETDQQRTFTVYRGQGLTKEEFEKLVKTKGGLISFNNFLSTSRKRKVSLDFAEDALNNLEMIGVLFKMIIDPANISTPYADIDEASYFSAKEKEILFSMHTIFRIGEIKQIENKTRLYQVELKLTSNKHQQLNSLTNRLREETSGSSGWYRLAMFYIKLGQFSRAQDIYEILFPSVSDEREKAFLQNQLGLTQRNQSRYRAALVSYQKALTIYRTNFNEDYSSIAILYNNIAQVYSDIAEYNKALVFYQRSLELHEKHLPSELSSLAIIHNNIGMIHRHTANYLQALSSIERALTIELEILPSNHPSLAVSHNNLGLIHKYLGNYTKAMDSHRAALAIEENALPSNHPSLATSYNNIASLYNDMGEYDQALTFYEKSMKIYQEVLHDKHADLATLYNNIGSVYKNLDDFSKAVWFYEQTLKIEEATLSTNHPALAITYSNLGVAHNRIHQHSKALEYHQKALSICQDNFSVDHPMLSISYHNLGSVYDEMENYPEALKYYHMSLEMDKKILSENHPDLAKTHNNIALVYDHLKDYEKALDYYRKALDIFEQSLPANHPDLIVCYNNVATVYEKRSEFAQAIIYYEKVLTIRQKILPKTHADLLKSYAHLWTVYQKMGNQVQAYQCYERSLTSENQEPTTKTFSITTIDQMFSSCDGTEDPLAAIRAVMKNIRVSSVPKYLRPKNFRTTLNSRIKIKKK